ncbi:MAG: TfoX/Sxy family protein [Actinomycetota bacterium]
MAKRTYPGPAEALAAYEAVVAGNPEVPRKGAQNPYTARDGNMFSFLTSDGTMALRIPPDRHDEFAAQYDTGPVEQYGATMRGYLSIPDELLRDTAALQPWFDATYDWIGTLPPKSTTRSTKSGGRT